MNDIIDSVKGEESQVKHGINPENLDLEANPRDDFYQYATGGWRRLNPLEGEYASFGVFNRLAENARDNVRDLISCLKNEPESKNKGTISQKIADLNHLGMDMERRNREGIEPLLPYIKRIEGFKRSELGEIIAWLSLGLDSTFFTFGVGPDQSDSNHNILHIGEAGIGLGDRDYYLEKNENNDRIMAAYRKYIADLMKLCGFSDEDARRISDNVIDIETEFAANKKTREERRDPLSSFNIVSMDELTSKYSNIPWHLIFSKAGVPGTDRINVSSPGFIEYINRRLPELSDRVIKDLMIYGCVGNSSGALSEDFYNLDFEMFSRVMSGVEEKKPLWKRTQGVVGSLFGEAIGELYVKKYFPPQNKDYMVRLVENLRKALGKHISNLIWMSPETKEKALEKLAAMKVKIGYPDKWKDYSGIDIDTSHSYMENLLRASEWYIRDNFSKLSKPVDKDEWHMYPQTVNAYYSPQMNEICFPAGILQPPFFDINAEDALNYGGIGVVIGHEMTHGFDDSGRRYDADGNLCNWWTEKDEENFNKLTEGLVRQFNEIEVAPGVYANGKYTLGENIADQGGLRIALTALKDIIDEQSLKAKAPDGFSPIQNFYLSYAGIWANNIREEEILVLTQSDPHSLAENRVNVTLKNIEPFIEAFEIKKGDKMFRPESEQLIIW